MRPLLKTALPRLWRGADTLQLGADPARSVVLDGVDDRGLRLLALLDGTRDVEAVLEGAEAVGVPRSSARAALRLLAGGGVLDDTGVRGPRLAAAERDRLAPDIAALALASPQPGGAAQRLARRRAARVRVYGACRVGGPVAALLAASGIGHVDVVDPGRARVADAAPAGLAPCDAGRRRDEATVDALRRTAPGATATADRAGPAALTLVAGRQVHDGELRSRLVTAGAAHLAAAVRELTGVVGPLVLPGRSPCLVCLELHRRDRDPEWPLLAAQLAANPRAEAACDGALAAAVAACAALQALAFVDGEAEPATLGGTLELSPPDHRWRRRSWSLHAECRCVA